MRCVRLMALSLLFCTGCVAILGLEPGSDTRPLFEPANVPAVPAQSEEFEPYGIFAVDADASLFSESMLAMDMGRMGVPAGVGILPLRKIASRGIQSIVENHFRRPRTGERPAFTLSPAPQSLSVRKDGKLARVKVAIRMDCTKQDAQSTRLLSEIYTAETTGPWVDGTVPVALYEALNEIWEAFLCDFRKKVRPATLLDGPEALGKVPRLLEFTFEPTRGGYGVATGTCLVSCNGWDPAQAAEWVKKRIFVKCVKRFGTDKDRVHVRYDGKPKYDSITQTIRFDFTAWEGAGPAP